MFKINVNNEVNMLNTELNKQNITNEIAFKSPFFFSSEHLSNNSFDISFIVNKQKPDETNDQYTKYTLDKTYNIPILKPFVRASEQNVMYYFKRSNKRLDIHRNLEYRNFYICKKGSFDIYFIHPDYKDNFVDDYNNIVSSETKIKFLKEQNYFKKISVSTNDIVYVPNYWIVYIESTSKRSAIQTLHYKSLLNELCFLANKIDLQNIIGF